jgi:choline dehydrogenase-like flavoprotein
MGIDADAVVDSDGKVNAVRAMRIADASIMPKVIAGNLNGRRSTERLGRPRSLVAISREVAALPAQRPSISREIANVPDCPLNVVYTAVESSAADRPLGRDRP